MPANLVSIYTDGASRGNPGRAAISFCLEGDGVAPVEFSEAIGIRTNNFAEYTAMIRALKFASEIGATRVRLHSDSELMVKQMRGQYRVKHADIIPLHRAASDLVAKFERVEFVHVLRGENAEADHLCNEALDGRPSPIGAADRLLASAAATVEAAPIDAVLEFFERLHADWTAGHGATPEQAWLELRQVLLELKLLKLPKKKASSE